jgi:hypothetical protein
MSCKVRTNDGFHYVKMINNIPRVYCGVGGGVTPTPTPTPSPQIPIDQNFFITLIDEAQPAYAYDDGTGVGSLWERDVAAFNALSNMNSDAVIVFDIGNRPEQTTHKILPNDGVGSSSPVSNIIETTRPVTGNESSQNALFDFLKSSIQNIWGADFWTRLASSEYKLVIIVDVSGSLTRAIIGDGLDAFEAFLTSENVDYQELNACANERWLDWILTAYNDPSLTDLAICGCLSGTPYCDFDVFDPTGESYRNSNCFVNKADWTGQSGLDPLFFSAYDKALSVPFPQYNVPYYDIVAIKNSENNFLASTKIKITVDDPVFSGIYVFDKNVFDPDLFYSSDHQRPIISFYAGNQYFLNLDESILNSSLIYSDSSLEEYTGTIQEYNNKYIVQLDFIAGNDDRYPGLLEAQVEHDIATSGTSMVDAYAFPGMFLFTAIKAPSDVDGAYLRSLTRFFDIINSGNSDIPYPIASGEGHRYVAAFSLPAQYRHSYKDYILMDWVPITLQSSSNTLQNDVTDVPSNIIPFSENTNINNATYNFVLGINQIKTIGVSTVDNNEFDYIVTGAMNNVTQNGRIISHSGVAYRVSAAGIPYLSFVYGQTNPSIQGINWTRAGIGRDQLFENFVVEGGGFVPPQYFTVADNRALFEPRIPSTATLEFVNKCENVYCGLENLLDISNAQNIIPTGLPVQYYTTGGTIECEIPSPAQSFIIIDYFCDENMHLPSSEDFLSVGITGYKVLSQGVPFYNVEYDNSDLPISTGVFGGVYLSVPSGNSFYSVYYPGLRNENQLIEIPYTGLQSPDSIRDFVEGLIPTYVNYSDVAYTGLDVNNNEPINYSRFYDSVDLIWTKENNTALALIVPNTRVAWSDSRVRLIEVVGDGSVNPEITGIYSYQTDTVSNYPIYTRGVNNEWQIHLIDNGPSNQLRWNIVYVESDGCLTSYYKLNAETSNLHAPVNVDPIFYDYFFRHLPHYDGNWEPYNTNQLPVITTKYYNDRPNYNF